MRFSVFGSSLIIGCILAVEAAAQSFAELCEAQGETREICGCANEALTGDVTRPDMQLYVEVSILNQMNLDDGQAAPDAWTNAAIEVAGGTGIGIGDVYENANRIEALHRAALAICKN